MRNLIGASFVLVLSAIAALAQTAVPDFRYVVTPDMDFYGSDLDALFDTDLTACTRACSASAQCTAFTFNTRSNACFPKSEVADQTPYEGAVSAQKIVTPASARDMAATRAADLAFLNNGDLEQARVTARDIGFWHQAGGRDTDAMLDAARKQRAAGNYLQAMRWMGGAVSVTDWGQLWSDYAQLLLQIKPDNSGDQRRYNSRAVSASVNAYLRAATPAQQASTLQVLAQALEKSGRGRQMIPALRLAHALQPRTDLLADLDAAVGKYGFRVAETSVESDTAAPRLCVEFTEPLVKAGVDYDSFVRLPDPQLVVQTTDRQLCIDGVEHGARYRFTLRQGLPAASGESLYKDVDLTLYVRDRSPSVRFPGRSYVLPKSVDAALPVETVNTSKLDLRLRRVSDRNLLRAVQDGYFGRPLSQYQDAEFASDIAQEVWTGTGQVSNALNQNMMTRLPMAQAIAEQPAGIYALTARIPGTDPYDDPGATQWFVLSDLGLSTMQGTDGLHVMVRGLADAQPVAGIDVTLVSRANAVLGKAVTKADGIALFEPGLVRGTGGAAPALVLAQLGDKDIVFLSLSDPAFDLSDRGVEGRAPAGPVDVFLTTDRGAYRAGETVFATVLARDPSVVAVPDLPLIAILSRPDGVEYSRHISDGGQAGGHVFALPVGPSVPRGAWRLEVKADPDAPALASQTVLVEDFLPERIDFDLSLPSAALHPGDTPPLTIDARYLFGAPGSDLSIEGQVDLRAAETVLQWPGYKFGRHDERPEARSSYFGGERTDADGQAIIALELPDMNTASVPMKATITARLSDGSARPVERQLTAPVNPAVPVIGIKPGFDDVVGEGSDAIFELIGLTPALTPQQMQVKWTLNRVETRYQWYQLYGNWNWEPTTRRTRIATGQATLSDAPLTVSHPVNWGEFELVVERLDGPYAATSVGFYAGWYAPADTAATPDRLDVSLDKGAYRPGDTAKLRIVPRSAGTALITVMSDKVISRQAVQVTAGETVVPIPVTQEWGVGAYVSATVIRPMDVAAGQNPARAVGLAHATIAPGNKALKVSIDVPEIAEPRQTQRARVQIDGAAEGDQVWLTLAAVDVGILNLTRFTSPDPSDYYFGQRRLGVELRDVYGRLIDGMNGAMGTVRSGGDANAGAGMQSPPPTQELMATFSGPVAVGPDGQAFVNIDLPAFNGTVRLMAVAWSNRAIGQAETDMIVRDPVVVTASVPRFLAPGDSARVHLEIVHADGPSGLMQLALDHVGAGLDLDTATGTFNLADGGKAVFDIPVAAQFVGDPSFDVVVTTPDGRELRQTLILPVRANDPVVATTRRFSLGSGGTFEFSQDVFTGLHPGTASALLSAGPLARFDAPGLLSALDRYPYGCTEQVTSQALPLLYLSSVAQAAGLGNGPQVQSRIDAAVSRVLSRQASSGSFGMWRADSGEFWLDAYVSDFLSRARQQGYTIPDLAFRSAMDNLRNRINYAPDFDSGGQDIAYALLVLAREGAAAMGDLRYYADVKADAFATPLAVAQIGAALALYGDQLRADAMFTRAAQRLARQPGSEAPLWRADFGTNLRDAAGVLALAVEAGSEAVDREALITRVSSNSKHLSTQESAWSLLAAQALIANPEQSGLLVDGAPVSGPFVQVLDASTLQKSLSITATNGRDTAITLTTLGVPEIAPDAGGTGYAIQRQYYAMDGEPLQGEQFKVGDRFVTVLTVVSFDEAEARLMIDDPLPAGIEIDNPSLLQSGDVGALDWLSLSEVEHSEFRSDRFLSAVNLRSQDQVTLAYVARAVTPGNFHRPAAAVEDMYRPTYRARTATGRVTVSE